MSARTSTSVAFDPDACAQRANPFALERVRYYTFGADGTLTLATRYDNGQERRGEPLEEGTLSRSE